MQNKCGVLLSGGMGTRLSPLTAVTNKAILPMGYEPMICHPLRKMAQAGIKEVLVVCGGNSVGEFIQLIGDGKDFGFECLYYAYQAKPLGIANALSLAEHFVDRRPVCVLLPDNIFAQNLKEHFDAFASNPDGARIFTTRVKNPSAYGVVEVENGEIISIEEKPKAPKSNLIQTGIYFYDKRVWDYLPLLQLSTRNEFEVAELNSMYLQRGKLKAIPLSGYWFDCGENLESYVKANHRYAVEELGLIFNDQTLNTKQGD